MDSEDSGSDIDVESLAVKDINVDKPAVSICSKQRFFWLYFIDKKAKHFFFFLGGRNEDLEAGESGCEAVLGRGRHGRSEEDSRREQHPT